MNYKIVLAANLITLGVVAYIGVQVGVLRPRPKTQVLTASAAIAKGKLKERKGDLTAANVAFAQAFRIGDPDEKATARIALNRLNAIRMLQREVITPALVPNITALMKELEKDPEPNPQYIGHLATLLPRKPETSKESALAALRDRCQTYPDAVWLKWQLAVQLYQAGELTEATAVLNSPIWNQLGFAPAQRLRGDILRRDGRIPEAIKAYERAIEMDRSSAATVRLGDLYLERKEWEMAMPPVQEAVVRRPTDAAGLVLMGRIKEHGGALPEARSYFHSALKISPTNSTRVHAARVLLKLDQADACATVLKDAIAADAPAPEALYLFALAQENLGASDAALAAWRGFIEAADDSPDWTKQIQEAKTRLAQ